MWFWAILILGLIWFAVVSPGFRKALLVALAAVVGLATWFLIAQNIESDRRRELHHVTELLAEHSIQVRDLHLSNVQLKPEHGYWVLDGIVANKSAYLLKRIGFYIAMRDCDDRTTRTSCQTVGEARVFAIVDVPAGQVRQFSSLAVRFPNLPMQVIASCAGANCNPGRIFEYEILSLRAGT